MLQYRIDKRHPFLVAKLDLVRVEFPDFADLGVDNRIRSFAVRGLAADFDQLASLRL